MSISEQTTELENGVFDLGSQSFWSSSRTDQLITAWIAAKEEMGSVVEFDSKNPHFKSRFASLEATLKKINTVFAKHGLALVQFPGSGKLLNRLEHVSGQWMMSSYEMVPVKNDPQAHGSALTYARRYCAQSIAGLSGGEDDDAESAMPSREVEVVANLGVANNIGPKQSMDAIVKGFTAGKNFSSKKEAKAALDENWTALLNQAESLSDRKILAAKLNKWLSQFDEASDDL